MTGNYVLAYPGSEPVVPASHRAEKVVLLLACVALGAAIGWRLGR